MANLLLPAPGGHPRLCYGWDGTDWRAMHLDAAGNLQVDVLASALPAGAATAANQVIINTTVGLVALIRNALQTVDTDRLIVRGEDQLFSFKGVLAVEESAVISGVNGSINSDACPAGEIWVVTNVTAADVTTATTEISFMVVHNGTPVLFANTRRAIAIAEYVGWSGHVYLDEDDYIAAAFAGGLALDQCRIRLTGYRMTVET